MTAIETEVRSGDAGVRIDGPWPDLGADPEGAGRAAPADGDAMQMTDGDRDKKVRLARRLAETRLVVDRVLGTVSESRLEARRLVTKELGIDPRPEILNTIVKVACDRTEGGLRRELPRHLLTLHSLIEHELAFLLDARELQADAIRESREMLPELLNLCRQIQEDLTGTLDTLTAEARDYVQQVCNSLGAPEDRVEAARLLAPRLELLARAGAAGEVRAVAPALHDDELLLLTRMFEGGASENSPGRICLNSIALRSLMCEDIARWDVICAGTDPGASVAVQPEYLERMGREKSCFHFVSERLQDRQDAALQAGLPGFADEVRAFRQSLFATYREFTPVLRDAAAGRTSARGSADDSSLLSLLEATAEADAATDEARANAVSKEELYLRALTDMRREAGATGAELVTPVAMDRKAARRRMRVLTGTAGTLLAICAAIYVPRILAPPAPGPLNVADLPSTLELTHTLTIGTTMYAQVSAWSWEALSPTERLERVEAVGGAARTHGMENVFMADDTGRELAYWNPAAGAALSQTED